MMGRVNADAALLRRGRYVTLAFVLGIGADDYVIDIDAGRIVAVARRRLATESGRFAIRAEGEVWREFWRPIPAPLHHDLFALLSAGLARIDGDLLPLMQNLQYFKDLLAAPRPAPDPGGVAPAPEATGPVAGAEAEFEPIIGRYFTMEVAGEAVRVYVEEAGRGIPLLCLHTAGADGRQFRHLMCDPAITDHYRVIAFDMPWHGKSNPPVGWEDRVYQLTTARYQETVLAFCRALALEKPVIMGCSMGGRVVLHLALAAPGDFRAVIALEGADRLEAYYDTDWLHRPDVHGGEVCAAFVTGQVAPQSPVEARMETLWMYAQSGPGVFKGDLHFYWVDGHFDDRSHRIDTARCPVYLLSGAYDTSCTPARARATAANIKGCRAVVMDGIGHFPMSENPPLFRTHLLPILDELRNR
jgi:pimeloyl-ACP methyl ester carboxylesterase